MRKWFHNLVVRADKPLQGTPKGKRSETMTSFFFLVVFQFIKQFDDCVAQEQLKKVSLLCIDFM